MLSTIGFRDLGFSVNILKIYFLKSILKLLVIIFVLSGLARLAAFSTFKRASLFNRDLRVLKKQNNILELTCTLQ